MEGSDLRFYLISLFFAALIFSPSIIGGAARPLLQGSPQEQQSLSNNPAASNEQNLSKKTGGVDDEKEVKCKGGRHQECTGIRRIMTTDQQAEFHLDYIYTQSHPRRP